MSNSRRQGYEHVLRFASGATTSQVIELGPGAWGTIIIPAGSPLIGKELQFVAVSQSVPPLFDEVGLLHSTVGELAEGANSLTNDQIREAGAATNCRLQTNSAVGSDASCVLLWKS